ncbi:DUF6415 family natural product biosynthesis protein [Streptomyces sp. NPDC058371]|uniref:DUF6415 family natural product biosynthesis protein n=1 Tax=Streptomyces sp. NPDC058371 TaxID=3346463 RepID=UPI003654F293
MNVRRCSRIVTHNSAGSSSRRLATRAAEETVALVLDEEAPVLDCAQDVTDLAMLQRGHLMQLGPLTAVRGTTNNSLYKALAEAQRLAEEDASADYMTARVHLRHFAQSVEEVLDQLGSEGPADPSFTSLGPARIPARPRRRGRWGRWERLEVAPAVCEGQRCLHASMVLVSAGRLPVPATLTRPRFASGKRQP